MKRFFVTLDDFLRGRGIFSPEAPLYGRLKWLFILLLTSGVLYGVVMGTFSGLTTGRFHQLIYSGAKVPLLLIVTFLLCLPSFFVINTVAGLRDDFSQVLRAVVATQSGVTVVLACLAPFTAFFYLSCSDYRLALLFNGFMFFIATVSSQIIVRRYYNPLIKRSPTHRHLRTAWYFLYIFVGIQMAWVLRPFIGDPNAPVAFFRSDAWGNAYLIVGKLIIDALKRL